VPSLGVSKDSHSPSTRAAEDKEAPKEREDKPVEVTAPVKEEPTPEALALRHALARAEQELDEQKTLLQSLTATVCIMY
jgi:hypothetical protein